MLDVKKKLILASSSPRRKMLLEQAGLDFTVLTAEIDETLEGEIDPALKALAFKKADAVRKNAPLGSFIIGADTVVCMDGRVFGKPQSEENAFSMLKTINGRVHTVKTGVCTLDAATGLHIEAVETTCVHISHISDEDILDYIETGEPMDKAGAYAAQGIGARFVRRIEGCYYNVVGLPLGLTLDLIARLGAMLENPA